MSWDVTLTRQVEQEFRDVARMRGAHEPREEIRAPIGPRPQEIDTSTKRRRIVGRRAT